MRKRLAAMQDWPLLMQRACTAAATTVSSEAEGMTMKGSLPPSSRTDFLMSHPAWAAMARPADSLPVTVTAATRSSASTISTWRASMRSVWKTAAGKAGAADQGLDGERALGDVGGVLEQADVAGHESGREKTEDLPEGEVPGHDGEDDAERVPADEGVEGRCVERLRRKDAGGVFGVVAAGGGALGDLGAGLGDGLAHLGGDERGEVGGLALQKAGELVHAERAVGEREFRGAGER